MSDDRLFERNAQAWLEVGPRTAPKRVVDAALLAIETTPQQRDLRAPWRLPHLTIQLRFAVAAAVALMIVGAGLLILRNPQNLVGNPSPSPTASPDTSPTGLGDLYGAWASVGTRSDPIGNHTNPPQVESISIDAAGLRVYTFKGDVASAVTNTGIVGQFTLRMDAPQDLLARQSWDCTTGDSGTYDAALSQDGQTLTFTSAGDECATRGDILGGDWTRWPCPNSDNYAHCDHVSELTPGRYVSPIFRPFGSGRTGQLAYTVPAGWANLAQPPTWPTADYPKNIGLTTVAMPDRHAIDVYSNLEPSDARAVPNAPNLEGLCDQRLPASGGTASRIADWLGSLPYVAVSRRTPVTIGGVSGVQIDVSMVSGFVDPCYGGSVDGGPMVASTAIEIFGREDGEAAVWMDFAGDDHARFIMLDTGSVPLVIAMTASGQSAFDALVAQAMPVVNSFEFIP